MTNAQQQLNANLTGQKIDDGALELVSVIGIGAYGVVYKARARDGRFYAVKCLNKTGLDSRQRSFQRREIALHTLASSHPNIVTLHNVIETSTCIYVVLSYCNDGDLFSQITEKSTYLGNDAVIKDVFLQIVEAVEYCHRLGIYHRDLKPENILCDDGGRRVVLADFGLATAEKTSGDFGCGSTFYMSPECQGGLFQRLGSYSTLHNDVWSLGVILVNLTCGRNPWKQACPNDETFRAYLSNPDFLRSILPVSKQCNELLKRIFALNPASRISIKDLKNEVKRMGRWTMTFDELRHATRATKEAARAWAPSWVLDDPTVPDAPPSMPQQPVPQAHQQPQQVQAEFQQQPQAKVKAPRETIFDITDSSTISSVDSLQEWRQHQAQQEAFQQQIKRSQAKFQGPHIPSPVTSPSVSSVCPEFPMPAPPSKARQAPVTANFAQHHQQHQHAGIATKIALNLRSNFSLSDSDETTTDDEDDDMDYVGASRNRSQPPTSKFYHQQHQPQMQQQYYQYQTQQNASPVLHQGQQRQSPSTNAYNVNGKGQQPVQHHDYATRTSKRSPPPLGTQSPQTPRQAFTSAHRPRKQSFESTSSSSSSASSDASWTGLPPTPNTPVFARRPPAAAHTTTPEKTSTGGGFSFSAAKLKLAF